MFIDGLAGLCLTCLFIHQKMSRASVPPVHPVCLKIPKPARAITTMP